MTLLKNNDKILTLLNERAKDWQEMIDTLPYSVSVIDTEFNVVMTNKAVSSILGNIDIIQHAKCYQLFHRSENPVEDCPMLKTLRSRKSEQTKIHDPFLKKTLIMNTAPFFENGNLTCVIHSVIDITEAEISSENNRDIIEIYANSINDLKARATNAQKGRDAFLNMLEDLGESYKDLEDLFLKLVSVMVNVLDAKSPWTKGHSERVSSYAEQIAAEMSIDEDEVKNIKLAGLLHDIGKIGTYDYLLEKPGRLTDEEFDIVKKHPVQGANILKEIKQLKDIIPYIEFHHEKIDGRGYPYKLDGSQIPLGARILHVADSFDSMTSDRPYRPAPGTEYALSELNKYKGTQFDHDVVTAFLEVLKKQR